MARLDATGRAQLPDRAFASIDSHGRRRLPIHDEAHVRNALARFNQVRFEDDDARERARRRLLQAAKRFGIVPVGFIDGQLRTEREIGESRDRAPIDLPTGFVTMLMSDIEGSTTLLDRLGDGYAELLAEVRTILRDATIVAGGLVVEERADEFFSVFATPWAGVDAALAAQRRLRARAADVEVRVRIGVHSGYPTRSDDNYIGMAVHTAARVCAAAHGAQIIVTGDTREAMQGSSPEGVRLRRLGSFRLRGIPKVVPLYQVSARGLVGRFPPPRAPLDG
jgi:class 3 adenylate cyclase